MAAKMGRGGQLFLVLFLLLALVCASTYGLMKMRIIDPEALAQQAGVQDNRLVREAIKRLRDPARVEMPILPEAAPAATVNPQSKPGGRDSSLPPAGTVAPLDVAERDKLEKARQQEEKKRISKLARLYEGMKPAEAVAILEKLDDDTIVAVVNRMEEENAAKVLAAFDASRAAAISEALLRNRTGQALLPQRN